MHCTPPPAAATATEPHRRLHAAILASFLTGAIVGPMAYLSAGHVALLLPCALLLALACFDAWLGLTAHTFAPSPG